MAQDPLYDKWIASGVKREPIPPGTRVEPSVPVLEKGGNVLGVVALGIGSTAFFAGFGVLSWIYAPAQVMLPVVFGLAAAGIFGYTIYDGLRRYKYGTTTLRLHNPVTIGRELSAELVLLKAPADLKEIRLALLCESTTWKLRRVTKKQRNEIKLQPEFGSPFGDERKVPVLRFGEGVRCQFRIPIPAGLPPSDASEVMLDPDRFAELGSAYHSWTLTAHADVAGADLKVSFSLAVQPR